MAPAIGTRTGTLIVEVSKRFYSGCQSVRSDLDSRLEVSGAVRKSHDRKITRIVSAKTAYTVYYLM